MHARVCVCVCVRARACLPLDNLMINHPKGFGKRLPDGE